MNRKLLKLGFVASFLSIGTIAISASCQKEDKDQPQADTLEQKKAKVEEKIKELEAKLREKNDTQLTSSINPLIKTMRENLTKAKTEEDINEIVKQTDNLLETVKNHQSAGGSTTPSQPSNPAQPSQPVTPTPNPGTGTTSEANKYQSSFSIVDKDKIKQLVSDIKENTFGYSFTAKKILLFNGKTDWKNAYGTAFEINGDLLTKLNNNFQIANPDRPTYTKNGEEKPSSYLKAEYSNNILTLSFRLVEYKRKKVDTNKDTTVYIVKFSLV
ncbi:hypothetical protein NPA07_05345 [Mycoplasmopsis caviae]|uniref:Variable surface lipoprotein n=1 Tax=Mycoplasmopsis caviae TaxID=55603 RepID=A0A3P8MEN0_9BACT|nr:hypothetical protein [Mycoplasmopsis caviae]UUD35198.1 hypothetical protein NPA07_05345 [Mycoplasmopsis caviae]VDR42006.1 Uncharacterised protein [Mycoplasmopsis caviae]